MYIVEDFFLFLLRVIFEVEVPPTLSFIFMFSLFKKSVIAFIKMFLKMLDEPFLFNSL